MNWHALTQPAWVRRLPLFWRLQLLGWGLYALLTLPLKLLAFSSLQAAVLITLYREPLGMLLTLGMRHVFRPLKLQSDNPRRMAVWILVVAMTTSSVDTMIGVPMNHLLNVGAEENVMIFGVFCIRSLLYSVWSFLYFWIRERIASKARTEAEAKTHGDSISGHEAGLLGLALAAGTGNAADPPLLPDEPVTGEQPGLLARLFPEYRFGGILGRGGFGTVWRVRHRRMERDGALKVLASSFRGDAAALSRFEREMRAAAQLDHPGIVRVGDAGEREGVWFLAMEYVSGSSLGALCAQTGPLKVPEACEIAVQVLSALAHAHGRGLIHRDVKPGNVMVVTRPMPEGGSPIAPGPTVKLLDFGLAQFAATEPGMGAMSLTVSGEFLGTLDYAAPEQVERPRETDARVDVFGAGVTLWHLLTGRSPREETDRESSLLKRLNRVAHEPLPSLLDVAPQLPRELALVVDRMVAHAPEDRFESAQEAAEALLPFTQGHQLAALLAGLSPPEPVTEWQTAPMEPYVPPAAAAKPRQPASPGWWKWAALILAVPCAMGLGALWRQSAKPAPAAPPEALRSKPDLVHVNDLFPAAEVPPRIGRPPPPGSPLPPRELYDNRRLAMEAAGSVIPAAFVFHAAVNQLAGDPSRAAPFAVAFHPRWPERVWWSFGHGIAWAQPRFFPSPWIQETPADGFHFSADGRRMVWTHPGMVSHVELLDFGEARQLAASSPWGDHPLPPGVEPEQVEMPPSGWRGDPRITQETAVVAAARGKNSLYLVPVQHRGGVEPLDTGTQVPLVDLALTRDTVFAATRLPERHLVKLEGTSLVNCPTDRRLPQLRSLAANPVNGDLFVITSRPEGGTSKAALQHLRKRPDGVWQMTWLAAGFQDPVPAGTLAVSADGKRLTTADASTIYVWEGIDEWDIDALRARTAGRE